MPQHLLLRVAPNKHNAKASEERKLQSLPHLYSSLPVRRLRVSRNRQAGGRKGRRGKQASLCTHSTKRDRRGTAQVTGGSSQNRSVRSCRTGLASRKRCYILSAQAQKTDSAFAVSTSYRPSPARTRIEAMRLQKRKLLKPCT